VKKPAPPPKALQPSSRYFAATIIERVTDEGAYASKLLDATLRKALTAQELEPRDAAFITEIVYGTLRTLQTLDRQLGAVLRKPLAQLEGFTRAVLRISAYQLFYLNQRADYAIVDSAVNLVKKRRGPRLASFVNAVLRKISVVPSSDLPAVERLMLPEWLEASLLSALGEQRLSAFLNRQEWPPSLSICVNSPRVSREALSQRLARELPSAANISLGQLSPNALRLTRAGDLRKLASYQEGLFSVQEEGAQLLALMLDVQEGERVADVCAGHGGKTMLLAQRAREVVAFDLDQRKLEQIPKEARRLGLESSRLQIACVDLGVGTGGFEDEFDRVLVDAPCSGTGTLLRRPEIALRLKPDNLAALAALQLNILIHASRLLRPGGLLMYAVCSLTQDEGEGVLSEFLARVPGFECIRAPQRGVESDPSGIFRLGPWLEAEIDGYQMAILRSQTTPTRCVDTPLGSGRFQSS